MMKYFFKVSLIVTLFLVATYNGAAQKDTLFYPPYSYFVIDNEEWVSRNVSYYAKLRKKDNALLEAKARYKESNGFLTMENLLEKASETVIKHDKLVLVSSTKLDENAYFLEFAPNIDECSEYEIPKEFLSMRLFFIIRYINSHTLWTLEFDDDILFLMQSFPLKEQLIELYSKVRFTTPSELDKIMGYPLREERINYEVNKTYQAAYNENYSELLKKRKCYDDESLLETLKKHHPTNLIDSLARFQKDSTLAHLYAQINSNSISENTRLNLLKLAESGYTHTEYYSLLEKSQNSGFKLDDYLDLVLDHERENGISRLRQLSSATGKELDDDDYKVIIGDLIKKEEQLDSSFVLVEISRIDDSLATISYFSTLKIKTKNYFLTRENGTYIRKEFEMPQESISELNESSYKEISRYIDSDLLSFSFDRNATIAFSKQKNLLLLSKISGKPSYYQATKNIGSEWKKIPTMSIDTAAYLVVSSDLENTARTGTILWDKFSNQEEKKRLESIVLELTERTFEYHCQRDSLGALISIDDDAKYIIKANMKPQHLLLTNASIADIDNDKQDELIQIAISNGKIISQNIFKLNNGTLEKIPSKSSLKILQKNTVVLNTLLISQIKNHTQEKLDDPQRLFGFDN